MRHSKIVLLAVLLGGFGLPALAIPIVTFNYSGTIDSGGDSSNLFGGGNPLNGAYTGSISYDSGATTACNGKTGYCAINITAATGVSESFTFKGLTQTFSITAGQIQFNVGGASNQIGFYGLSGPNGFNGNIQFNGGSSFFGPYNNVINTTLLTGTGVGQGNFGVGTQGYTYFNFPFQTASASSGTPVQAPEPGTLALFGAGLLGIALRALRRRSRPTDGLATA